MTVRVLTPATKKVSIYADFHKDLTLSPVSNDLALLKDEDAVKDALKNLLLTDPGERLMQPYLGGGIRELLFENMTPGVLKLIQNRVETTIKTYEPRAELIDVTVTTTFDENAVGIRIQFYIVNRQQPISLDVILERIR
jgi:phage baseplate assembly protein W